LKNAVAINFQSTSTKLAPCQPALQFGTECLALILRPRAYCNVSLLGRELRNMVRDANLRRRLNRQGSTKGAKLKGLKFRVISGGNNRFAELLKLEAENADLRRRAAELALEIHVMRGR